MLGVEGQLPSQPSSFVVTVDNMFCLLFVELVCLLCSAVCLVAVILVTLDCWNTTETSSLITQSISLVLL